MAKVVIYDRDFVDQVRRLFEIGVTVQDVADILKVSKSTIYKWRKHHREFDAVFLNGRRHFDAQVASALIKRLVGYEKDEVTTITDAKGKTTTKVIKKHYPSDATTALKWLMSRHPDQFVDIEKEVEPPKTKKELLDKIAELDSRRKELEN